ncbi:unnamed protein product [Amoebophrya sp. A25]|nr:unnamed protein product [Amoebophrya sp. A25]|eukprot:GSA25T00009991001.1
MTEAYNLGESYDLRREQLHNLFSSTIFDCLIYKGYGHRVSAHDHFPYPDAHFALELGHKDMLLAKQAAEGRKIRRKQWPLVDENASPSPTALGSQQAEQTDLEMPFLDALDKKFQKAKAQGALKQLDWSAIALV